ncbi:cysteine hydrolase [Kitasatospora sp. NPDC005748]|uniref:cysteine hydrolase family protein n=1 Tax=Kitasatospora sp. NPDC005748 TaxID=3157063 RepID=UPI0033E5F115
MTTADPHLAPHPASSALVTIDLQRDFLSESPYGIPGTTEVLPQVRRTVEAFRAAGRPVVHVVRLYEKGGGNADLVRRTLLASGTDLVSPGSEGSGLAPALAPLGAPPLDPELLLAGRAQALGPSEYAIFKPRWGAFYRTPLQELLEGHGVDTVVLVGCNFPNCPRATLIQASERDYRVVAVPDAISRTSEQGLAEVAGLGVQLLDTAELLARFGFPAPEEG